MTDWLAALEPGAPDVVAAFRALDAGRSIELRREVRRRADAGTAEGLVVQLALVADAVVALVGSLPEAAFGMPGGEGDWTVAEAVGHDAAARVGLAMAAGLAPLRATRPTRVRWITRSSGGSAAASGCCLPASTT
jgi:hypothetical protein